MQPAKVLTTMVTIIGIATPCLAQGAYYDQGQGQGPPQQGQQYAPPPQYAPAGAGYPPQGYPQGAQGYLPQRYPQPGQGYQPAPGAMISQPPAVQGGNQIAPAGAKGAMSVAQWFHSYDQIRHQAQMSPAERQRADALLSRGLSMLMPGDEKIATKNLLTSMVLRYQKACQQLKALPQLNQTTALHHAYYNYFATAGQLFSDYLRVQDNLLTTDAATGQPLATSLIQRKQMLEAFEHECKQMDTQTRGQYGIAAYPW
ncbi:MAG TPA: hypothetical protein V6D22_09155 [Candidatus Obscuribacterales bacterium]